jgi:uracil-DNA glycosylase
VIERIPPDWSAVLAAPLAEPWVAELDAFVVRQYAEHTVYPPAADVFAALRLTPFASVRAVILGQDPYHQPDRAHGLAFSVPAGVKPPGSLRNILAEWARDLGRPIPTDGSLIRWAAHGVLLLNTLLTVRRGEPTSHANQGWERLTGAIIAAVAAKPEPIVFLLWGAQAQAQARRSGIDASRHIILASTHPSPRSARRASHSARPFVGSAPFRRANEELVARGQPRIDWELPSVEPQTP